jgi:hypothetical protein
MMKIDVYKKKKKKNMIQLMKSHGLYFKKKDDVTGFYSFFSESLNHHNDLVVSALNDICWSNTFRASKKKKSHLNGVSRATNMCTYKHPYTRQGNTAPEHSYS